ncbi:protein DpdG [Alphaproteobacteria bacterium]|nr:protein DpdG [Alphaproteobacteria bacterium]
MTILNNESDGDLEILITMSKYLLGKPPLHSDDIKNIFVPNGGDPKKLNNTILRWSQLGLFIKSGENLSLSEDFSSIKTSEFESAFPKKLCQLMFSEDNSPTEDFFKTGKNASDLTRGIAWMLCQDPLKFSQYLGGNFDDLQSKFLNPQCNDKTIVQNNTRWPILRRWASFLGFVTGTESKSFLDPTLAVERVLPDIFEDCKANIKQVEKRELLPLDVFIKQLAIKVSVFDGGTHRLRVSSIINEKELALPLKDVLSKTTSLALKRLEFRKKIKLVNISDAASSMSLDYENNSSQETYDYIEVN